MATFVSPVEVLTRALVTLTLFGRIGSLSDCLCMFCGVAERMLAAQTPLPSPTSTTATLPALSSPSPAMASKAAQKRVCLLFIVLVSPSKRFHLAL